jgi:glycosyltransferase involved in cell wall biosynthesis
MRADETLRWLVSFAPLIGLAPRPEARPDGISAVVRVRGEEEWIEPCLLSIRHFADEILVLDNGASQGTHKALDRLQESLGRLVRLERCPQLDLFQLSNLGLEGSRFRWVIRWDADFVAHTSGPGDIQNLRRYLLGLDPRRYHLVYVAAAEVAGDLFHQFPDRMIRFDGQAHTASRWARYARVEGDLNRSVLAFPDRILREGSSLRIALEALRVPKFYRILRWKQVAYFHVNVKSAPHTLMRHFWLEWLRQGDFRAFPSLESYARAQIRDRWGAQDPDEASRQFMAHYCKGLARFDADRCGPYPELLHPFLTRPRYRVEYRDGGIFGRRESW